MTSTPDPQTAPAAGVPVTPPEATPAERPVPRPKRGKRIKATNPPKPGKFVDHRIKAGSSPDEG